MSVNVRGVLFWLFTSVIALLNMKFLNSHHIWIDLLVRVPQAYLLGIAYRRFVNRTEMKTNLTKWRLKGNWHKVVWIFGTIQYFTIVVLMRFYSMPKESDPLKAAEKLSHASGYELIIILFCIVFYLPMVYAFLQTTFLIRIFTVWVYNNHRKWFEYSLAVEEIVMVILFTLVY